MIRTIGVIGGGQLGRMFALEAKQMGFDVVVLDPQEQSPCGQVADEQIVAAYDDLEAIYASANEPTSSPTNSRTSQSLRWNTSNSTGTG